VEKRGGHADADGLTIDETKDAFQVQMRRGNGDALEKKRTVAGKKGERGSRASK